MFFDKTIDQSVHRRKTPFLLTDLSVISNNYRRLKEALSNCEIYYAIKSNNDPAVISHLQKLGSNFDVASWPEIMLSLKAGVSAASIIFSAPIKKGEDIQKAFHAGVRKFTFDCVEELDKLQKYAPNSQVILRIMVESEGSQCPMFTKFGVYLDQAIEMLIDARQRGLTPLGLTFHVGSQCTDTQNWIKALSKINLVWNESQKSNLGLSIINLGGGLPVSYSQSVPEVEEILKEVNQYITTNIIGVDKIFIEPGRYMTGNASTMVSSVIGKAARGNAEWLYLDVGGFNGLFEILEGFDYEIKTDFPNRPQKEYSISGPTCDGLDIIRKKINLPEVHLGDRLYILNAGAYSISMKSYNGFSWAKKLTFNSSEIE